MFKVKGKNIFSYRDFEFDFGNRGLVLVEGENLDNPQYRSNGSGKTSAGEILAWVLYGESSKTKSPDKVVNLQEGKDCVGEASWDGYKVIRYRRHHKYKNDLQFYIDGEERTAKDNKTTQELINKALGLNYHSFVHSVYFRQATLTAFASASDAEQKAIIEDILALNILSEAQKLAKEKVLVYQVQFDQINKKRGEFYIKYSEKQAYLNKLHLMSNNFEIARQKDIESYQQQILKLENNQETPDFDFVEAEKLVILAEQQLSNLTDIDDKNKTINSNILNLQIRLSNLEKSEANYLQRISFAETQLKSINDSSFCPTCKQPLQDKSHIEKKKMELTEEVVKNNALLLKVREEIPGIKTALVNAQEKLFELADSLKKRSHLQQTCNQLKTKIAEERIKLQRYLGLQQQIEQINQAINTIKNKENPHLNVIEEEKNNVTVLDKQLKDVDKELHAIKSDMVYYEYWKDGFSNSRLPSYIMESITPVLNERTNHYLQFLTGGAFQVDISTQTKLKSGEIREKFAVNVITDTGTDYDLSSGGERKRIDIAILLALSDLVQTRANKPLQLLIMDECTENLDAVGCEKVLELLHVLAKEKGSVFYITQDDNMKTLFPTVVTVVKENGISTIKT